jgi:hypothetical protein
MLPQKVSRCPECGCDLVPPFVVVGPRGAEVAVRGIHPRQPTIFRSPLATVIFRERYGGFSPLVGTCVACIRAQIDPVTLIGLVVEQNSRRDASRAPTARDAL